MDQRRVGTPSGGIADTTINTTIVAKATSRAAAASISNAVGRIRERIRDKETGPTGRMESGG
jgi:hypothetical protein